MTEFSQETLKNGNYERYVLVKGSKLRNVQPIISEWFEIFGDDESTNLTIKISQLGNWIIIKLPRNEMLGAYNYHNLVYWFLGTPPEDENYADFSIGISIDKEKHSSYLIYNDYDLRNKIATDDDVFGIFENNQKFILSVPFDEMKPIQNKYILDFNQFLENEEIDLTYIKMNRLNWTNIKI